MSLTVRTATQQDLPALLKLYTQLSARHQPPAPALTQAVWQDMLRHPGMHVLLAELEGRVVGTLTVSFLPNLTRLARPYGVIENVVVDFSVRRQGVGQALMAAAETLAHGVKAYKLMLMTGHQVETAQAFYRSCGYDQHSKAPFEKRFI